MIVLKRCPFLRTILHRIISECWRTSNIPSCWTTSLTTLIYKKNDPSEVSNFRPITLQPTVYKVMASVLRNRLYKYLDENGYIDKHSQKEFWPSIDGVAEHTSQLTFLMKDAKLHQRSIIITLLDLKNAFGEISHNLISSALLHHHVPEQFIGIISNIYRLSQISVSVGKELTPLISVRRGVLQGDPISPLFFNVCFNLLTKTITQPKFAQLGYIWGPNVDPFTSSCLQFADDTVLISRDVKSAQMLIDLYISWCRWVDMEARIDKCLSFGMRKLNGIYSQFTPNLTIKDAAIPSVKINDGFTYLGKYFDFLMDNESTKTKLIQRLTDFLRTTSTLKVEAQLKLEILRLYISSQFSFDLRICNISYTWLEQNLDSLI